MKRAAREVHRHHAPRYSAAIRCGLIEASPWLRRASPTRRYSAAIRCGLIEAGSAKPTAKTCASYSAAIRCGLIEARIAATWSRGRRRSIPQRFAAASLKQVSALRTAFDVIRIPQRFAAASLKLVRLGQLLVDHVAYSAAIRCGLIEAWNGANGDESMTTVFRSDSLRPH